jgi:hypothetical protein
MSSPTSGNATLDALDAVGAPLYHALGRTLTRWQFVESGMFLVAHAILGTDYKLTSAAFFRFKNADAKFQFLDDLCEAHFDKTVIEKDWRPLAVKLRECIGFRNCLAHFEMNLVSDPKYVPKGDPPVVLSPHHMDVKSFGKSQVRAVNLTELNQMGENYRVLARSLILLVREHFALEKLRATHLPPAWRRFLETVAI